MKHDLMHVFEEFYSNGVVCKSMYSNFITLVRKIDCSCRVKDFRPISLTFIVYKILATMLASRLGRVLVSTVTPHQSAFAEGRQILDVPLIANEVAEDVRGRKRKGVVCKLDFEKAYDRVCWFLWIKFLSPRALVRDGGDGSRAVLVLVVLPLLSMGNLGLGLTPLEI